MAAVSVHALLTDAARAHLGRRRREAVARALGGGLPAVLVGALVGRAALWAGIAVGLVLLLLSVLYARRVLHAARRSPEDLARAIDRHAASAQLVHTALCIETGRSRGSAALGAHILAEGAAALPGWLHHVDTPVQVPRELPIGAAVALALLGLMQIPLPPAPTEVPQNTSTVEATPAAPPLLASPSTPAPVPERSASEQTATASGGAAGADRQSSGGAERSTDAGTEGGAGGAGAEGTADATAAQGEVLEGGGSTAGSARDAGTSGTSGEASPSAGMPAGTAERARTPHTPTDAEAAAPGQATTGMVDGTGAETDAVRSTAETLGLADGTPDDTDAQTRDVAGTLDLQTSGPQFFDATETADAEQDGKGGAGGWTIGLSQPGEGGVNDASGSTWRTEAGVPDPPDWTDAPAEWVDAAWQDSPAGVIRRVRDGQAGGSGSMDYTAAWQRYAAVAEAASQSSDVPPGRRALVRQYFLAIAPPESP